MANPVRRNDTKRCYSTKGYNPRPALMRTLGLESIEALRKTVAVPAREKAAAK